MYFDSYEMAKVSYAKFKWEKNFLTSSLKVSCLVRENGIIKIKRPDQICLTISLCDDIANLTTVKNAFCETELKVIMPIYIYAADKIYVLTSTNKYVDTVKSIYL